MHQRFSLIYYKNESVLSNFDKRYLENNTNRTKILNNLQDLRTSLIHLARNTHTILYGMFRRITDAIDNKCIDLHRWNILS